MSHKDVFCYVDEEVAFGTHQRLGTGYQGSQPGDERVGGFSVPPTLGEGRGLGTEFNHQWTMI